MKFFARMLLFFLLLLAVPPAGANANQAYEDATMQYLGAIVSMATYHDRAGKIAREELAESGWYMQPYNERFHGADAKFFIVENAEFAPGKELYILAITGTESAKDLLIDLNFDKVFFGGSTPKEFIKSAGRGKLTSKDPMVHRGFNKYAQAAFFTRQEQGETFGEYLAALLKEKPSRKLYIVGHSLGGAVATVGAARLISLGVPAEQIKAITYGAPAVGNKAFAEKHGKRVDLSRVVIEGDPIEKTLQAFVGGYTQFGNEIKWRENRNVYKRSHSIVVYADSAIRNFYDKRGDARRAGFVDPFYKDAAEGTPMVYVAPPTIRVDAEIQDDAFYLEETIKNTMQRHLPGYVFGQGHREKLQDELRKAEAAGCGYLVLQDVQISKVKTMRHVFYADIQEDVYSVKDRALLASLHRASGTRDFTPILANLHNVTGLRNQREEALRIESR